MGDSKDRRYHLVPWEEIKKPFPYGGLGVRSLVEMNIALQGKWLWRFMIREGTLWKRVIDANFRTNEKGQYTKTLSRLHGRGMWKKICMRRDRFQACIKWRVGKGDGVNFWQDWWLELGVLRDITHRYFL